MIIIGITGKKRSGKDTFADFIIKNSNGTASKMSFADSLKDEVAQMLNISRARIEDDKSFFRPLLQWYGTEWRRGNFGSDYWITQLKNRVSMSASKVVIVPDVRFRNEAELIKQMKGTLVRVEKEGENSDDRHASEIDMDGYEPDVLIVAKSGDHETLRLKAAWLIDQLEENETDKS